MSGAATRKMAADGLQHIRRDPLIEIIPQSEDLSEAALRLFSSRSDKDWSLTDCLSFVVMERRNLRDSLTADNHFEQAGFRAVLLQAPPLP